MKLAPDKVIKHRSTVNLGSWQLVSLVTSLFTLLSQLVRGFIVTWILTPSEYGLVGIVTSIGSTIGVVQHLGLQSGTVKETSAARTSEATSQVLLSAMAIRLLISIPLALGLFWSAPYLAYQVYEAPEILFPLRLFAVLLVFQGIQEVCNAFLSGLQRFGIVFSSQAINALLQIFLYLSLTSLYKLKGYFLAQLSISIIMAVGLGIIIVLALGNQPRLSFPQKFKDVFKRLFGFTFILYIAKIFYMIWARGGVLLLGLYVNNEQVGYFNFALLFASQILLIGDAISKVNMPIMSSHFINDKTTFGETFKHSFKRVWALVFLITAILIHFGPSMLSLIFDDKYNVAYRLIPFLCITYASHTLLNVVCSSIIVTSNNEKHLALGEFILNLVTFPILYITVSANNDIQNAAIAMMIGEVAFFIYINWISQRNLQINLVNRSFLVAILILSPLAVSSWFVFSWLARIIIFTVILSVYLIFLENERIFTIEDMQNIIRVIYSKKFQELQR